MVMLDGSEVHSAGGQGPRRHTTGGTGSGETLDGWLEGYQIKYYGRIKTYT